MFYFKFNNGFKIIKKMTVNLEQDKSKSQIPNFEGFLEQKVGSIFTSWKSNYYINDKLAELFINQADLYK